MEQNEEQILDDPVWEYTVATKLLPYIPAVRRWWEKYEEYPVRGTGVFNLELDEDIEIPSGLMLRVTSTPVRSPIKNVQAFPFVPTGYLQIGGVKGGVNKMIERVCHKGLTIEGFRIIEKHNLPSTYQSGQFLAFIPGDVLNGVEKLGRHMYITCAEMSAMAEGRLPQSVIAKCYQFAKANGPLKGSL